MRFVPAGVPEICEVIDFSFLGGSDIHRSDIVGSSDRGSYWNMQTSQPVPLFMGKQSIALKSALIVAAAASAGWFGYRAFTAQRVSRETDRLAGLLELRPTSHVADVGAGDGAYSLELASRVVTQGQVFATEIGEEDVANIRAEAVAAGLDNITVIQAGEGSSNLSAGCCDAIFLAACTITSRSLPRRIGAFAMPFVQAGGLPSSISSRRGFLPRSFLSMAYQPTVVGTECRLLSSLQKYSTGRLQVDRSSQ